MRWATRHPTGRSWPRRCPISARRRPFSPTTRRSIFTTPHFNGYPAILVRLELITIDDLTELITEAWLARAPKRLVTAYLNAST
jgi:hypothetical protein